MCTLTLVREATRLTVTMNRDDAGARLEAPPEIWRTLQDHPFLAPKDMLAGGSWIGVNTHGVAACLLNRYDPVPSGAQSRGKVVIEAMSARSVAQAEQMLFARALDDFSPFTCVLIGAGSAARFDWTGDVLTHTPLPADGDVMLTSSSWRFDEVRAQREELFGALWTKTPSIGDRLSAFHCRRDEAHDAWMPMMRRKKSQTKSITQITLTEPTVAMRYWTRSAALARQLTQPDTEIILKRAALY